MCMMMMIAYRRMSMIHVPASQSHQVCKTMGSIIGRVSFVMWALTMGTSTCDRCETSCWSVPDTFMPDGAEFEEIAHSDSLSLPETFREGWVVINQPAVHDVARKRQSLRSIQHSGAAKK
jgi:hypothetical protein